MRSGLKSVRHRRLHLSTFSCKQAVLLKWEMVLTDHRVQLNPNPIQYTRGLSGGVLPIDLPYGVPMNLLSAKHTEKS